jgi:uncharacterized membrane protein YphA (DoxX/SURF4 family)
MSRVYSIVALVLRLALAGIFLFAAYNKLRDPLSFSESIQAFRFPLPDWQVLLSTYAIPWTEIFCGVGLALGLWSRASAFVFILMMGVFLFGIISAIERHLPLDCGCFGKFKLYCEGPIGWCKVRENCLMMVASGVVLIGGGGRLALDGLFERNSGETPVT